MHSTGPIAPAAAVCSWRETSPSNRWPWAHSSHGGEHAIPPASPSAETFLEGRKRRWGPVNSALGGAASDSGLPSYPRLPAITPRDGQVRTFAFGLLSADLV